MSEEREQEFRKNRVLEELLSEINTDMQPSEHQLLSQYVDEMMQFPLILIMGPLRSGTTLFTQWLANTGLTAYPTNLLSRFYGSPILGAKIQLLLTDPRFAYRNELGEFLQVTEYSSENGKTKGVLAPNEFWYFWRRFLTEPERDVWSDEELRQSMDVPTMKAELVGMMDVFQRPFAAKGMLFNYNIPFLDSVLDQALFIQVKRDPVSNVASILEARKRQLGSEYEWYSFSIPEYPQLRKLDPVAQSAGQMHYINKAVTRGMACVNDSRKMVVEYEQFCENPAAIYAKLAQKIGTPSSNYSGPQKFKRTRTVDLPTEGEIKKALAMFES